MSSHFHRQHGGTLLGLIIGLVAGLAIALLVALIVTKSPVPFNNKPAKPEKSSTSSAQQSADPNQPLYRNKEAVKQAAKEFAKEPEPVKASEQPNVAGSTKDEVAATNKSEEKWSYFLQAGAFRNTIEAENMRARLALLGYEAGISEMLSQTGTLYRVRIGPFTQVETMNRLRSKLKESGVNAGVIRNPK